jgi:G3E family GTPase
MVAIPITVVTGFLGSGKTTLILGLLRQLPKDYKAVLLKNEFGDVAGGWSIATYSSPLALTSMITIGSR